MDWEIHFLVETSFFETQIENLKMSSGSHFSILKLKSSSRPQKFKRQPRKWFWSLYLILFSVPQN